MRTYAPFCIGLLLALAATAAAAEGPQKPDQAQALFRSAFEQQLEPDRRVQVLERIVKEHPESPWADDALWVLGEAARRQQLPRRVLYYWQFLMARWPGVHLEDYTRSLEFYRLSPVGGIEHLLEAEGTLYSRRPGRVIPGNEADSFAYSNAVAFNPAPMLVWEELGDCYARLGKRDLAAAAYRRALAAAPVSGSLSGRFRQRMGGKLEAERAEAPDGAKAAAPNPEAQPAHAAAPEPAAPPAQAAAPAAPASGTAASD